MSNQKKGKLGPIETVKGVITSGFVLAGGHFDVIIKAAPFEMMMIGGAAIGAFLIGNSFKTVMATGGGFGKFLIGLILGLLIGAALVYLKFPTRDEEERLLADYHATDAKALAAARAALIASRLRRRYPLNGCVRARS